MIGGLFSFVYICAHIRGQHRAWQALAVLCRFITEDTLADINARLYDAMGLVTIAQIRWHMEMFMARLCMMFPRVCLAQLVERVAVVNMRPQVCVCVRERETRGKEARVCV